MSEWDPTPRQSQAIALLATGETVKRTAQLVGVTERTLWNWRRQPAFRAAVRESLAAALDEALAVLTLSAPKAARLIDRSNSGRRIDRDRLTTARWTLERFRYLTEQLGMGPADDAQSRLTVSQSLSLSGAATDLAALAELARLLDAPAGVPPGEGRQFPGELAPAAPPADPPPD